eukprot:gene13877-64416_t
MLLVHVAPQRRAHCSACVLLPLLTTWCVRWYPDSLAQWQTLFTHADLERLGPTQAELR